MRRSRLLLVLAGIFAGLTVLLLGVAAYLRRPFMLVVAAPLAVTAFVMWAHATGRLGRRVRQRRVHRNARRHNRERSPVDSRRANGQGVQTLTDAYRTLGLEPGVDIETVRRTYREQVKAVHPDRPDGSETAFKEVNAAYRLLRQELEDDT